MRGVTETILPDSNGLQCMMVMQSTEREISMWELFMKTTMTKFSALLLATALLALAACSDNTGTAVTTTTTTTTTGDAIVISASPTSIKTDGSSSTTLTATVTAANVVVSDAVVTFATNSGYLSAGTATTNATGQATVTLSGGASDFSNRTATVSASNGGRTASIPVLINGSTLTLTASSSTVRVGDPPLTLSATAKDAGLNGKYNQTIRFSIGATSTGAGTLSAATLPTDVSGDTAPVTFTPTSAGTVVVTAEWLDASGAVSVTVTKSIDVTAATGIAFAITTPATDPTLLALGASQNLVVTVPATIAGSTVTSVRINSTGGIWDGASASITKVPVANAVSATYTASNNSGAVTVQVDALGVVNGVANTVLSTLMRTFVVSAPASAAGWIDLQASMSTIPPSSGGTTSSTTLQAIVKDASGGNSVGGAPVLFELLGTTGSGESISPAVVYTDSKGIATATFSAGSLSTQGSVYARARVVGAAACTGAPHLIPAVAETSPTCSSVPLIVSAAAVSISIGFGTGIADYNSVLYSLPGSILVVDGNGTVVSGAVVTLTVFPFQYRNGSITEGVITDIYGIPIEYFCVPPATSFVANEDVNRNASLDPGEDTGVDAAGNPIAQTGAQIAAGAISANNAISPNAAAGGGVSAVGVVSVTVTTNISGVADFNLLYPKDSAEFIFDEVTARLLVAGTEQSARTYKILPWSKADSVGPTAGSCKLQRTATY